MGKLYWQNACSKTGLQKLSLAISILKIHWVLEGFLKLMRKTKALIDANYIIRTHEITELLNLSNLAIHDHMKCFDLLLNLGIWITHIVTEINLLHCIYICDLLLNVKKIAHFWSESWIEDEKWIVYNNVKSRRSGLTSFKHVMV